MKQSLTMQKVTQLISIGGLKSLTNLFSGRLGKDWVTAMLKKVVAPLASILLFIGLWHSGAKALYNMEADFKIEKALNDQGEKAAEEVRACIAAGETGCQPNTLPSPAQVWAPIRPCSKTITP